MSDGKPGFSFESAASIVARDMITKHLKTFGHVIRNDRVAGQSTSAAYIDGLAGALAYIIAGGAGDKEEVLSTVIKTLRDAVDRDLRHLRAN